MVHTTTQHVFRGDVNSRYKSLYRRHCRYVLYYTSYVSLVPDSCTVFIPAPCSTRYIIIPGSARCVLSFNFWRGACQSTAAAVLYQVPVSKQEIEARRTWNRRAHFIVVPKVLPGTCIPGTRYLLWYKYYIRLAMMHCMGPKEATSGEDVSLIRIACTDASPRLPYYVRYDVIHV